MTNNGVTIREVARAAGVSAATVSRALRGLPSVAPATREKVEAIAADLEYVPDPYAARLASKRGHAIIVAVPLPGQWYYAQIVAGAEAASSDAGLNINLHVVGDDLQRKHFIEDVLLQSRRVDGAILAGIPIEGRDLQALLDRDVLMVGVGERIDGVFTVGINNFEAAREATDHLIARGHRRIALLGGVPSGRGKLSIPSEREAGFRKAMGGAGLEVDEAMVLDANFSIRGGADAAHELLSLSRPPTAVFALSDEMAAGAVQAAREAGVSVPDELAVMGFDDHDFAAAMGITTVRQPVVELGETATQALLEAVDGVRRTGVRILRHELIERDTTGPAPAAG